MEQSPDESVDALRRAVLRSWRDSPTRFTEDTHAEHDLRVGAYRDRVFVELAQNAADAAALAGAPGRLRVRVVDGELRVANTGAPLDRRGIAALASLRASGKPSGHQADGDAAPGVTVGRFGVGFAAVLAVTSEPRIVSRTGGVAFSEARTRQEWDADEVPVLRLPWALPADEPPVPDGFDTEVRLPMRAGAQAAQEYVAAVEREAADVLVMLPWLVEIDVEGRLWRRHDDGAEVVLTDPDGGRTRWLTQRGQGCTWAVPIGEDGRPRPLGEDVLHTPTPTDERLSLPARLLTTAVPMEPSRRRVLASADSPDVVRALRAAAEAYPGLVRALPAEHRLALVPRPHFPVSDVDGVLRDLVVERLAEDDWLPSATSGLLPGRRARVLDVDAPHLVALLADVVPGLVAAPLCGRDAVRAAEIASARGIGIGELVEAVGGIERPPAWWRDLYTELLAVVDRAEVELDELGALPVPLADGRTWPGARGVLLVEAGDAALGTDLAALDIPGLHVAHPEAVHPLLRRLGAVEAGPAELLRAPAVVEAIARSVDDTMAGLDVTALVESVLTWVSAAGRAPGLGALALPTASGRRRADELVLPDSALLEVLHPDAVGDDDAPLDVLDAETARRWDREVLLACGVRDTFTVLGSEGPDAGPEPDDELSVPDLDLVADEAWPRAIRLLASQPDTWRVLTAPDHRLRDWLSAHALLAGRPPRHWRLPSATELAGLFDPVPDVGLPENLLALVGVRAELAVADTDPAHDAELLCARLADPQRTVSAGLVLRAHSALSAVPPDDVEPPDQVRTLAGTVCDADDAVVLDAPWLLAVWPADRLVAAADFADAPALADVLDLPLASDETDETDEITATVAADAGEGSFAAWSELPAIVEVADLLGIGVPAGGVVVHDELTVAGTPVPWWRDTSGDLHASDSPEGLARAFAWSANRWSDRVLVERLLDDPDPRAVLG
ncbi:sacsin N-terminal ATP-binding-like domain-containing protein [Saccharomonospora azurea]|uniref:sacsin N-terminal ATP-binding-like domain-containing protein n=1 Tax=Saccharomonospora azurea TaxID=40988 RepID=UPI0024095455|nr:molecular chaperone Hsp90 [Saccharomonospora azurea]